MEIDVRTVYDTVHDDIVSEMVLDDLRNNQPQYITSYHKCNECGEYSDAGKHVAYYKDIVCYRCFIHILEESYFDSCIR